jgi:hypothetical protein
MDGVTAALPVEPDHVVMPTPTLAEADPRPPAVAAPELLPEAATSVAEGMVTTVVPFRP